MCIKKRLISATRTYKLFLENKAQQKYYIWWRCVLIDLARILTFLHQSISSSSVGIEILIADIYKLLKLNILDDLTVK